MKGECEGCNKKATIHLTEIVDGQMTEMHLCDECPKLKSMQMEQQFGVADLLAGLTDFDDNVEQLTKPTLACKNCDLTYKEFKKYGRLGCSQCYSFFKAPLEPLLKNIHGSNLHYGKIPSAATIKKTIKKSIPKKIIEKNADLDHEINDLKIQQGEAIERQDFEQAALLRDKIRELEKKNKKKL